MEQITNAWVTLMSCQQCIVISAMFKLLRKIMKNWAKNISNLSKLISNCNMTIAFLDKLEEIRTLYHQESLFRDVIVNQI